VELVRPNLFLSRCVGYRTWFFGFERRKHDDDKIVQIELYDDGDVHINGNIERVIDVGDSVAGIVVDREMGHLFVSVKNRERIVRYDAELDERNGDDSHVVVRKDELEDNTLRGLTLYYNGYKDGYLIVSLEDDSTFAVYERNGDNDYVGTFTIGKKSDDIDRTDGTLGVDVVNVNLGPDFECGVFIAQDSNNDRYQYGKDRSNFKLVPFDEVSGALKDKLDIDTTSWGPRRFNLAIWVDVLSQDIYCALVEGEISGRDAEDLLDFLAQAVAHIYPPASSLRQMMEPYYTVRDKERRRFLARRQINECDAESDSSSSSWDETENERARRSLQRFRGLLHNLRADGRLTDVSSSTYDYWRELSLSIIDHIHSD